jgi:hypothetical protein
MDFFDFHVFKVRTLFNTTITNQLLFVKLNCCSRYIVRYIKSHWRKAGLTSFAQTDVEGQAVVFEQVLGSTKTEGSTFVVKVALS